MKLLAHLTEINGCRKEQSLKEHCLKTAVYAADSIGSSNLRNIVYLAGVLHDAGKAKIEFAEYLEDAYQGKKAVRGTINHTFAAVIWLLEQFHGGTKWDKLTCEIIAYAVGAHHGMFDCIDLDGNNGFLHRLEKDREEICYTEAITNFFSQVITKEEAVQLFNKAEEEVKAFYCAAKNTYETRERVFFQISMLVRLTLSAVIYGDRRDTGEFIRQKTYFIKEKMDWKIRREYFEKKLSELKGDSALNQVRSEISRQCLESAQRPEGIYRLNVPTGAGKTLCLMRFALSHAERYQKKRIIFVIPLLSVLDQNVQVIRRYLPYQEEILEHHSNVIHEKEDAEELDRYELLADNWEAPFIVTTLVQLLQILFSHQTTAVGRMHALCDSVIMIDEVQSLPKKVTEMFNMAMNFFSEFCHATILLSSATQPCFEDLKWPLRFADQPDMVTLTGQQLQVFERAEIIDDTNPFGMDMEECAQYCREKAELHASLLVICNTKAEARILYEKMCGWAEREGCDIFHLSTAMCQEHRQQMMEAIRERLPVLQEAYRKKKPLRRLVCISTQLAEAGIDLSFGGVVRILAGIDNLAQAAGRCNRSNEYGTKGAVYFINLKNETLSMLHDILAAQNSTRKVLALGRQTKEDIIGVQSTKKYYRFLFEESENELKYPIKNFGSTLYLSMLLGNANAGARSRKNQEYCLRQPFLTAGKEFKVFDQNTTDILVPFMDGEQIIERLQDLNNVSLEEQRKILQQTKKYTISIYEWQKKKLDEAGLLYSVLDGRVLVLKKEAYSDAIGLIDAGQQAADTFII